MYTLTVYRCEDSLESIFTAIYLSYEENRDSRDTCMVLHDEPILFAENVKVEADPVRTIKVIRKGALGRMITCLSVWLSPQRMRIRHRQFIERW